MLPPCVFATFSLFDFPCLTQPLQCLDFFSWGQLLHEEMWAWENVGFGRLLSVWMVRMPSGEPSFLSCRSSFSPWSVTLTVCSFSLGTGWLLFSSHAQGLCVGLAHVGSKGKSRSVAWDFRVQEPFHAQGLCVSFLTNCGRAFVFLYVLRFSANCTHAQTLWGIFPML